MWFLAGVDRWGTPETMKPSLSYEIRDHCKLCHYFLQRVWNMLSLTYLYSKLMILRELICTVLWETLSHSWHHFPWWLLKLLSPLVFLGLCCSLAPVCSWPEPAGYLPDLTLTLFHHLFYQTCTVTWAFAWYLLSSHNVPLKKIFPQTDWAGGAKVDGCWSQSWFPNCLS